MLKKDKKATNQSYHLLLPVGAKYQCTKTNIIIHIIHMKYKKTIIKAKKRVKQEQIVLERSARLNLDPGRGD